MNVFLSWSGDRGRLLAEALNEWLPKISGAWRPWVSSRQKRGADWRAALFEHINAADACVLCVTSDSINSKWLAFEAGMMSRRANVPMVVYELDLDPGELSGTPYASLPIFSAMEIDTRELVSILNAALPEPAIDRELRKLVSAEWPGLERHIENIESLEAKPFTMFVMLSGVVARYDVQVADDAPWGRTLSAIQRALADQYGVGDVDVSGLEYFDLDDRKWISPPRRLSGVKTGRLVLVHPDRMREFSGGRSEAELIITVSLDQQPREARANALIRRDLEDLARRQSAHQEKHGSYAFDLAALEFYTATEVSIEILEATDAGWCAVGSHKDVRWRLGVRYGATEQLADNREGGIFPV